MGVFGWALLGVVLGAAGAEFLRKHKPELVQKVEDAAKRLVSSVCSPGPSSHQREEKE
jgi:hypothetical protein